MSTKSLMDHRIDKILNALEVAVPKLQDHENRITHIENNMICDSRKRVNIKRRVEQQVRKIVGSKDSPDYQHNYRSTTRQLWHDYWNTFSVTTYHDTPAALYETVIAFIDNWVPNSIKGLQESKSA